jgi:hypothetical protein
MRSPFSRLIESHAVAEMLSLSLGSFPRSRALWFAERARMPTPLGRATYSELSFVQVKEERSVGVVQSATVSPFRVLLSDLASDEDVHWERIQRRTRNTSSPLPIQPTRLKGAPRIPISASTR